jgi:hypothetical protein
MKHFLKLIEIARTNGVCDDKIRPTTQQEWTWIKNCRNFVVASNDNEISHDEFMTLEEQNKVREVDAPFPIFSFEYSCGYITNYVSPDKKYSIPVLCAMFIETRPNEFIAYTLEGLGDKALAVFISKHRGGKSSNPLALADIFCKTLPKCKIGKEITRINVKIGTGQDKEQHRIREVIHLAPRTTFKLNPTISKKIDWTHAFDVRGHWRQISGRGKDRNGEYVVDGFTWVKNYVKGEEKMPFVKKIRLVENMSAMEALK